MVSAFGYECSGSGGSNPGVHSRVPIFPFREREFAKCKRETKGTNSVRASLRTAMVYILEVISVIWFRMRTRSFFLVAFNNEFLISYVKLLFNL